MRPRLKNALLLLSGFALPLLLWVPIWLAGIDLSISRTLVGTLEVVSKPLLLFALAALLTGRSLLRWQPISVMATGAALGCVWLVSWRLSVFLVRPFHNETGILSEVWYWGVDRLPLLIYPVVLGLLGGRLATRKEAAA